MAFRVKDANYAFNRAVELGATPVAGNPGPMELNIPAIEGIGGSRLYLVDRYGDNTIYDIDFIFEPEWEAQAGKLDTGLTYIDHLTHNVHQGNMSVWAEFYERLFNFREISLLRYRGQDDRTVFQGDDKSLRQAPDTVERKPGRSKPDRRVPQRL